MPQLTTVTSSDGTGDTPHVFTPVDIIGGVATLESNTGVPIGNPRLTFSMNRAASGKRKFVMKLSMPVVQDNVVNGVSRPVVVRTAYAECTLTFDASSTTSERNHIRTLFAFLQDHPITKDAVENVSAFY